jgi:hypothetical protein
VSIPSVTPAVATGTTADEHTASFEHRFSTALAIAELQRQLNRIESRLLATSSDAAMIRRRRHLQLASVYALDDLLAR